MKKRSKFSLDVINSTIFRDVLFTVIFIFAFMMILLLMLVKVEETESTDTPAGQMRIEIFWPNEYDTDVDLWVKPPGTSSIGYSNMNSAAADLVRDDLGHLNDLSGMNYETLFSRGMPHGEWIVNVHLFSDRKRSPDPIPVKLIITIRSEDKGRPAFQMVKEAVLHYIGEEITLVRFTTDQNGTIVRNSINEIPKMIRSRTATSD